MLLSIVTATFNRKEMLLRLKNSIDCDTNNIEWVIVDDGSTDGTDTEVNDWISQKNLENIKYIKQENTGRARALNKSILASRGKYIIIMDDDDWFKAKMLVEVIETLNQLESDIGLIYDCDDQYGCLIGDSLQRINKRSANFVEIRADYNIKGDKKEIILAEILKSVIQEPYPGERRVPTSLFWGRCARKGTVKIMPKSLIFKTYHPEGMTDLLKTKKMKTLQANRLLYKELIMDYRKTYKSFGYFIRLVIKLFLARFRFA